MGLGQIYQVGRRKSLGLALGLGSGMTFHRPSALGIRFEDWMD